MCFDVSIPIRLIWSTDGFPLSEINSNDLILAHSMPRGPSTPTTVVSPGAIWKRVVASARCLQSSVERGLVDLENPRGFGHGGPLTDKPSRQCDLIVRQLRRSSESNSPRLCGDTMRPAGEVVSAHGSWSDRRPASTSFNPLTLALGR